MDAHLFKCKADITADILALVIGSDIAVACKIVGYFCGKSVFIQLEKSELAGSSEAERITCGNSGFCGFFEEISSVAFKWCAVSISDIAEHSDNPSLLRPPRKNGHSLCVGEKEQILSLSSFKA